MNLNAAFDYIGKHEKRYIEELMEFLRIPSISALPEHDKDVAAALEFDKKKLESLGFRTEVWPTRAHAGLFAEKIVNPDFPTVLIYGHVDVQPVDPLNLWEHPPFEPRLKDGAIWARGADDNKGQHYAQIVGVESVIQGGGGLPVNVKFVIESDEEYDGEALAEVAPKHKEKLKADVFVVSDSHFPDMDHPAMTLGLRGIQTAEVTIQGPSGDKHSGEWGGMLYEPVDVLRWVLQNLKDFKTGRVLVPGFYDDVLEVSAADRKALNAGWWNDAARAKEIGVKKLFHEEGFTTLESGSIRPTLQANGIIGGYTGEGFKTVTGAWAKAKISMRLVRNQDPEKIYQLFERYVRELVGDMGTVSFKKFGAGRPFRADLSNPFIQAGMRALEAGFGKPAIAIAMGGSIPIVAPLVEITGAPCAMLGFGLPGDNLHAPNEHFPVACYLGGARSAAAYLNEVASAVGAGARR
ncbi:MAG TPA: dipeptidase [Candidatus Polarisedimenticolia bacterium]|nr:dipeptidase [Candidatus Polarisedimenticolia bacterium]